MSHSAPQPHPLESDSDPSLSPKMISEDEIVREVSFVVVNVKYFEIVSYVLQLGSKNYIFNIRKPIRGILFGR